MQFDFFTIQFSDLFLFLQRRLIFKTSTGFFEMKKRTKLITK
jgi:hypothetical protein